MIKYRMEIRHQELNKYRCIVGTDEAVVNNRAKAQLAVWNEQWQRTKLAQSKEEKKQVAAQRTEQAETAISELRDILTKGVSNARVPDWESLKDHTPFQEGKPNAPMMAAFPREPQPTDSEFSPKLTLFDWFISSRRFQKRQAATDLFIQSQRTWQEEKLKITTAYQESCAAHETELQLWKDRKKDFLTQREDRNDAIEQLRIKYPTGDSAAIELYMDAALSLSIYPDCCSQDFEGAFIPESGIFLVDYLLPTPANLPKTKQVRYIMSRDVFEESFIRPNELNALYDSVCYQICLRTVHEIFTADTDSVIKAVIFNGWVNFIDPATGKDTRSCILSLQAVHEEFTAINLKLIDPKTCFKALKGVGSAQLYGMAAVPPLLRLNRQDHRFVESIDIADHLYQGTNLAAIGWEDFEQLVREIFEKEFSSNGGEVKITRASRDGGVDAIAFDPDPIRGGKIVIQAKRYTNTVEVSAVRDLYGTVMNEGATKGILVTTSNFGPDSYSFAKDKPITLLDGGNLLYLLERHGHKAYINLLEAKKLNNDPLSRRK